MFQTQTQQEKKGKEEKITPEKEDKVRQKEKKEDLKGDWVRGVPLGVCSYISSPLSGTRQKGCRAERNGEGKRKEKQYEEVRGDLISYSSGRR